MIKHQCKLFFSPLGFKDVQLGVKGAVLKLLVSCIPLPVNGSDIIARSIHSSVFNDKTSSLCNRFFCSDIIGSNTFIDNQTKTIQLMQEGGVDHIPCKKDVQFIKVFCSDLYIDNRSLILKSGHQFMKHLFLHFKRRSVDIGVKTHDLSIPNFLVYKHNNLMLFIIDQTHGRN